MFKESDQIEKFEPKVWLSSPTMHGEEFEFLKEAYETNWMSTVGANINEVERLVCKKIGCKYAVGLSAGTAALHMAVKLAGVKPGEKVFCSDMTFSATVNPIVYEGGVPVFIDTEYDTWNMDPEALEKAFELYPDVKVVVIAHLYGTPGKVDELRDICEKHGAVIIEDAAESMGATYKGLQTGTFGKYNAISFNGNKIITGSSGGMLLTDDKEAAEKVRKWSTQSRENAPWYQHEELGYNYRMSNVIAGVVRGQIPHLEEHIAQKKAIYDRYKEGLDDKNGNVVVITSERSRRSDDIPYGLTKAASNSFIECFASKVISEGIRVNGVAPGVTASDMTGVDRNGNMYANWQPSNRFFLPEEVAEVVNFLLSDVSNCISGEIIACDQGRYISHW